MVTQRTGWSYCLHFCTGSLHRHRGLSIGGTSRQYGLWSVGGQGMRWGPGDDGLRLAGSQGVVTYNWTKGRVKLIIKLPIHPPIHPSTLSCINRSNCHWFNIGLARESICSSPQQLFPALSGGSWGVPRFTEKYKPSNVLFWDSWACPEYL